jgi:hypothetical protein
LNDLTKQINDVIAEYKSDLAYTNQVFPNESPIVSASKSYTDKEIGSYPALKVKPTTTPAEYDAAMRQLQRVRTQVNTQFQIFKDDIAAAMINYNKKVTISQAEAESIAKEHWFLESMVLIKGTSDAQARENSRQVRATGVVNEATSKELVYLMNVKRPMLITLLGHIGALM